jgi:hypothetical protein
VPAPVDDHLLTVRPAADCILLAVTTSHQGRSELAVDNRRPIFVVGYQRSGTTLLQALLGAHPRIASPPETHFIFRVAHLADYFGDLADDTALRRALHEALDAPVGLLQDCGFDEDGLYERLRAGPRSYRRILEVMLDDFAARHGKERWSEKTPTQSARSVFHLFPDAQVIHIVRDPRDVVASSVETPWTHESAYDVARAWCRFTLDNIRAGLETGPASFLQVRYEDLTRDPEAVLRVVCAYLGETFAPEMLDDPGRRSATIAAGAAPWQSRVLEPVVPARTGRWRESLSRRERSQVAAVVAPLLPSLGHQPPRRTTVAAGHVLNLVSAPTRLPEAVERWAVSARARTPERRYAEVQRYLARIAGRVAPTVDSR